MAQLTITTTLAITLSGLPEDLSVDEQQEIADQVASQIESTAADKLDLDSIAENLDLAGTWELAEPLTTVGEPIVVVAKEE